MRLNHLPLGLIWDMFNPKPDRLGVCTRCRGDMARVEPVYRVSRAVLSIMGPTALVLLLLGWMGFSFQSLKEVAPTLGFWLDRAAAAAILIGLLSFIPYWWYADLKRYRTFACRACKFRLRVAAGPGLLRSPVLLLLVLPILLLGAVLAWALVYRA